MINRISKEIEIAYKSGLYVSALSLALMLPDICSKAEYPNENFVGVRYKKWFNEYMGDYEKSPIEDGIPTPYLSGEVVYSLRCKVLHSGTPNIETDKIHNDDCKVDRFIINTNYADSNSSVGSCSMLICDSENNIYHKSFTLNLHDFCKKITRIAKSYYRSNKEKFDFIEYELVHSDGQVVHDFMLFKQPEESNHE